MRYLLFTLLGFFGPALLMLLLRLIWFRIRYQWLLKRNEPEIIDVTPVHKHKPGRLFMISWLLISMTCTAFLLWQLDDKSAAQQTYIPAHINANGDFVPAQTIETNKTEK